MSLGDRPRGKVTLWWPQNDAARLRENGVALVIRARAATGALRLELIVDALMDRALRPMLEVGLSPFSGMKEKHEVLIVPNQAAHVDFLLDQTGMRLRNSRRGPRATSRGRVHQERRTPHRRASRRNTQL